MMNDLYDKYNRGVGYGQMAPGRDLPTNEPPGQPGRPRGQNPIVGQAIMGGMPVGGATPFKGAQQTINSQQPSPINSLFAPGTGITGTATQDQKQDIASQAPQVEAAIRSGLNGYEPSKLNAEHAAKSPKYAFGMLAREFDDTPEGLLAMSKDPRFAAAGFQYVGKDKILAPDPSKGGQLATIDVGLGFSAGGRKGWQWGYEGPSGATPMASPMSTAPMTQQQQLLSAIEGNQPQQSEQTYSYSEQMRQQLLEALSKLSPSEMAQLPSLLK